MRDQSQHQASDQTAAAAGDDVVQHDDDDDNGGAAGLLRFEVRLLHHAMDDGWNDDGRAISD